MKFIKCIDLQTEGQSRKYQKGQTAKDRFNNLHVLQGVGKDGSNVWLLVRVYQHDQERYRFNENVRDLKRARAALRKVQKLESSFNNKILTDVRPSFYEVNQKSKQFLDPSKLA